MFLTGTILNVATVLAGTVIGVLLGTGRVANLPAGRVNGRVAAARSPIPGYRDTKFGRFPHGGNLGRSGAN